MSCFLTNSSLGKKLVMSLTGCFLVLFILFHMSMNLVAIISPEGYNTICAFLGANWYALAGTVVLAAGVLIHFAYALWLTYNNYQARGKQLIMFEFCLFLLRISYKCHKDRYCLCNNNAKRVEIVG